MKRTPPTLVILLTVLSLAALACWLQGHHGGRLRHAEVEGFSRDRDTDTWARTTVRVEDPAVLAQVGPWRASLRQQAGKKALRRLLSWFGPSYCENALRQPMERLTLVYEDGRREQEWVNVYRTPFRDCWKEAKAGKRHRPAAGEEGRPGK